MRVNKLEEQMSKLVTVVHSLSAGPNVPLVASLQQSVDISAPPPPPTESLYKATLKRSLSNDSLKQKKKKRKGRRKMKRINKREFELSIASVMDCVEKSVAEKRREESKLKDEFLAKKLEELNKNLKLCEALHTGVESIS